MIGGWEYYSYQLSDETSEELVAKFSHLIPDGWKPIAHHMTIVHRSRPNQEIQDFAEAHLGETFQLEIGELGQSDVAMALKVVGGAPSANALPHITLAVAPNGKPVQSNYIKDWTPIEKFKIPAVCTKISSRS